MRDRMFRYGMSQNEAERSDVTNTMPWIFFDRFSVVISPMSDDAIAWTVTAIFYAVFAVWIVGLLR